MNSTFSKCGGRSRVTTSITLSAALHDLLRELAYERARCGSARRISASAVIESMLVAHEDTLREEVRMLARQRWRQPAARATRRVPTSRS